MEKPEKLLSDVIEGKIDTACCPEVDEIFKRFQKGEATIDELRSAIINKQDEIQKV